MYSTVRRKAKGVCVMTITGRVRGAAQSGVKNGVKLELCEPLPSTLGVPKTHVGNLVSGVKQLYSEKSVGDRAQFLRRMRAITTPAGRAAVYGPPAVPVVYHIADVAGLQAALDAKVSVVDVGAAGGQSLHDTVGGVLRIRTLSGEQGAGLVRLGQLGDGSVELSANSVTVDQSAVNVCVVSSGGELSFPMMNIAEASANVAVGYWATNGSDKLSDVVAVGAHALRGVNVWNDSPDFLKDVSHSVAIGQRAGMQSGSSYAVALGDAAGYFTNTPRSVYVGIAAASTWSENHGRGTDNVFVGMEAGRYAVNIVGSVYLGKDQGRSSSTHNELRIGNRSGVSLLEGTMGADAAGSDISLNAAKIVLPNLPTSALGLPAGAQNAPGGHEGRGLTG